MATVLALGCHPDDLEFMCAGTLFHLAERGHKIHVGTLCVGDLGAVNKARIEITRIRLGECRKAAEILGAQFHCAMLGDVMLEDSNEHRAKAATIVRRANPDVVMTMPPNDYMVDHEITSRLVRNACFLAPIPNYAYSEAVTEKPIKHVPALYYTDAVDSKDIFGNRIQPHFYVDITANVDKKARMLSCHESQREWLQRQHGVHEYLNAMRQHAAARGKEVGVQYAEAFLQHRGHAYPQKNLLKELLGDLVIEEKDS
jgi:LmbE family N-acetylglucosaminyl deacetylase